MPSSNPPAQTIAAATAGALGTLKINGTPTDAANPTAYVKEHVDTLLAALGVTAAQILAAGGIINPMTAQHSLIVGNAAATVNEATVAKGASATKSNNATPNAADQIIDLNNGTIASNPGGSSSYANQWFRVDLGSAKAIIAYRYRPWGNDQATASGKFVIESSTDDSVWTVRHTFDNGLLASGLTFDNNYDRGLTTLTTPATARYWRMRTLLGTLGDPFSCATLEFHSGTPVGYPIELIKGANYSLLGVDGSGALAHQTAPTLAGLLTALALKASGMTGAVTPVRLVGGTADGAPTSGTFAVGDYVVTLTGKIFVCSAAGTPGTWKQVGVGETSWTAPTLLNSWVNYGGAFQTAGYYKDNDGVVHLRGLVKSGASGTVIFTLPSGYRPTATDLFAAVSGSDSVTNTIGRVNIDNGGDVTAGAIATGGTPYLSLAGITFRTT